MITGIVVVLRPHILSISISRSLYLESFSVVIIIQSYVRGLLTRSLWTFLDRNGKISGLQSGNRKLHFTETTLLHYTDQLLKNMDEKHISLVVLLDMSKAFDSIRHDNLLSKLHSLGVSESALVWF